MVRRSSRPAARTSRSRRRAARSAVRWASRDRAACSAAARSAWRRPPPPSPAAGSPARRPGRQPAAGGPSTLAAGWKRRHVRWWPRPARLRPVGGHRPPPGAGPRWPRRPGPLDRARPEPRLPRPAPRATPARLERTPIRPELPAGGPPRPRPPSHPGCRRRAATARCAAVAGPGDDDQVRMGDRHVDGFGPVTLDHRPCLPGAGPASARRSEAVTAPGRAASPGPRPPTGSPTAPGGRRSGAGPAHPGSGRATTAPATAAPCSSTRAARAASTPSTTTAARTSPAAASKAAS